jgi:hypothetical protein
LGVGEEDLALNGPVAQRLWSEYARWQGHNNRYREISEKWVPYHTVLGAHELFVVQEIHGSQEHGWNKKQCFLAMLIFRAHCRPDLFKEAQLPLMTEPGFWKDPARAFEADGVLEKSMMEYRRRTGKALQTSAFRCIPARLCEDNDLNLVRNILQRSADLLVLGEILWPIVTSKALQPEKRFSDISTEVRKVRGLGETWAKMVTTCIDISYPDLGMLDSQSDVGVGALESLRMILGKAKLPEHRAALKEAKHQIDAAHGQSDSAESFWSLLGQVESLARGKFKSNRTMLAHFSTPKGKMSAVTLQVQLCEWRQFCLHLNNAADE